MSAFLFMVLFHQGVAPLPEAQPRAPLGDERARRYDAVLRWNEEALQAIRQANMPPPLAARALALLHVGLYDTLNTLYATHEPYLVRLRATADIDPIAGCCGCAQTLLGELFPKQAARFRSVSRLMLEAVPNGATRQRGLDLGVYVARRLLQERKEDSGVGSYRVPAVVGIWRPTPPDLTEALLPAWGNVKPLGLRDKRKYRAPDPPDLTSEEYARDFNAVKALGSSDSPNRSADQTLLALFWNDDRGTCTLPGHWNRIAAEVSLKKKLPLAENARLFALLNLALVDAGICCWQETFRFRFWRPITAIHQADRDANEATVANRRWKPLLATPPFPSYPSDHSTFSGAAAALLEAYFKQEIPFRIDSEGLMGVRSYPNFRQAAQEAGRSRIYGGVQFEFDHHAGLQLGKAIAQEILQTRLTARSLPADPTVCAPRGRP